jgi:DNA polymerase III subunit beta
MKLTIGKAQIIEGLQAVQNIVSSRTTLPILSNVLLRTEGSRLEITATDLDVSISCSVEAEIEKPGEFTIPGRKIFGIVRELAASEIELEVDEKITCSLRAGSSFYRINGLAAEEFPPIPKFGDENCIILPQEKVRNMVRRTSFAVSTDETRYVLNGLYFSFKNHKLTLVATDGRRLALADEEVDIPTETQVEFIVPTKAIVELSRLMQASGEVEIRFTENQVSFHLRSDKASSVHVISKLVEGNFPNYKQVIPSETGERITMAREELLQAVRRAEIMTSDKSNSVKLSFSRNLLSITANTPEVGEAREVIAVNYKGADLAVAFNPTFLMDPLKALDNDEVFLELIDELSPGVIKVNDPFLYVIMPMRTS